MGQHQLLGFFLKHAVKFVKKTKCIEDICLHCQDMHMATKKNKKKQKHNKQNWGMRPKEYDQNLNHT